MGRAGEYPKGRVRTGRRRPLLETRGRAPFRTVNAWVFRNLEELQRIYCAGASRADGTLRVAPVPVAEDGVLEVPGPTLYGEPWLGGGAERPGPGAGPASGRDLPWDGR